MELNAEKVKKALEIHTGILDMPCEECPYNCDAHDEICLDVLAADALALITSQEQDKEKLGLLIDEIVKEKRELFEENKRLTAENERLSGAVKQYEEERKYHFEMSRTRIAEAKADTVRKMQERLKADAVTIQDHTGKLGVVVGVGNIDDVAREMLEGDNE